MSSLRTRLISENFLVFSRALGVKGLVLGLNATTIVLLPWVLGADSYAGFAILSSAMALAVGTFRTPIEILIQRSFQTNAENFSTFYDLSNFRFLLILSMLAGALLSFATLSFSGYEMEMVAVVLFGLGAAVGVISGARRGSLIVSHQTDRVDILDLLLRPAFFLLAISSYKIVFGSAETVLIAMFALSFLLVLCVPNICALRLLLSNAVGGAARGTLDWIKLVLSTSLSALRQNGDVILLASIVGGPIVGSYFILVRITDLLAFGNNYANLRYTHRFAKAVRDGDGVARRATVRAATRLSFAVALIGAVPALALGPWVLPMIQENLADLYLPFAILISGQIVNGMFGPRGAFLTSQWPGLSLAIKAVNSTFGLVLLYFLTAEFGLIGTACAVATSTITANLLVAAAFWRLSCSLPQKQS